MQAEKQTRVHWSAQEWEDAASYFLKHRPLDCESSTLLGINQADIISMQNMIMLPERHRRGQLPMVSIRLKLKSAMIVLHNRREQELEVQKAVSARKERELKEAQALESARQNQALQNLFEQPLGQAHAISSFSQLTMESLISMISDRVADRVAERIFEKINFDQTKTKPAPNPQGFNQVVARERKPKILIIGTLQAQGDMLAHEYPEFNVTHVKDSPPNFRDLLRNSDASIGMVSKMDHGQFYAAKATMGKRFMAVHGGLSSLRHQLNIWRAVFKEDPAYFEKEKS